MPFNAGIVRPAPLTFPLRPFPDEDSWAFLTRLALANHLEHAGPLHRAIQETGLSRLEALAALIDREPLHVALAIPTVPHNFTHPALIGRPSHKRRYACHHCSHRRTGSRVMIFAHPWNLICARHHRWVGGDTQFNITGINELKQAQRRHKALIEKYGLGYAQSVFEDAQNVLLRYARGGVRLPRTTKKLYKSLEPQIKAKSNDHALFLAASYPVAIDLTAALLSLPRGEALASINIAHLSRLISERAPMLEIQPTLAWGDPLRHAIDHKK